MNARSTSTTRDRILTASSELMRRNGYAGTGIKAILALSDTPYGSLYHHFPGGKEQLGTETLRQGGLAYLALVESIYAPGIDVVTATRVFFEEAAAFVESTDYVDACPIATIAGEIAGISDSMRAVAAEAFESWMSVELFCAIEGAFLLARTTRDAEPVRIAGRAAEAAVQSSIAHAPQHAHALRT
jgi:AcrR family transcriptional regulator